MSTTLQSLQLTGPLAPNVAGPVDIAPVVITTVRGFLDIPDAQLAAGQVFTDDIAVNLNQNARFGMVRSETIFMGFWKHGDTVPSPLSPVDGYAYDPTEVLYQCMLYSPRAPGVGFVSGQTSVPVIAAGQPTNVYWFACDINDANGLVDITISYFQQGKIPETITHDGMVKVYAICQRQSVNVDS